MGICKLKLLLQVIVVLAASLWLSLAPLHAEVSNAAIKVDQSFDHQQTRFPLEGAHTNVTCETCHAGAVFKGVPATCIGCHNDDMAPGKSQNHPKTSNNCADCHNQSNWVAVHVDHSKIINNCFSCHDGKVAKGKNKNHVKSSKSCETCHVTNTWNIAKFDHAQTNESCETCHDGVKTSGKPFTHIRSNNDCASCHVSTAWNIGVFNHTGIVDGCVKCHNGTDATGKSQAHLKTSDNCELCHTTFNWAVTKFDHTDPIVTGNACTFCHNGKIATGRAVTHFATFAACDECHSTATWKPVVKLDHALWVDPTNCFSCHNGKRPPADGKSIGHVISGNICTDCHTNTNNFTTWAGATFNHGSIVNNCATCHNGKTATGKLTVTGKHIISSETCENCHNGFTVWKPVSYAALHADSKVLATPCVTCHSGTLSISTASILGKLQGPKGAHLPTTNNCATCHTTANFIPAVLPFNHAEMTVTTCFTCHNPQTSTSTKNPLTNKTQFPNHVTSGNDCETCHQSFANWHATFDHSVIGNARCDTCHVSNGAAQQALPNGHLPFASGTDCANCHVFTSWTAVHFDHGVVSTTCFTCHNGTTAISSGPLTTKINNHIPSGTDCQTCHTSYVSWKTVFDHSTIGAKTCESCHNGVIAIGMLSLSGKHLNTPDTCISCHTTVNWLTTGRFDHSIVSPACYTCHNGTTAISKGALRTRGANHIPSGTDCESCHSNVVQWTAIFDHSKIGTKTCFSCHNGTIATGKLTLTGTHIISSNTCNNCHQTGVAWKPVLSANLHADSKVVTTTCMTCHNGTIATGKLTITGKHIPVTTDCKSCHTTTVWKPVPTAVTHADTSVAAQTCQTCHNNTVATGKNPATHILTAAACASCHTSTAKWTALAANFHDFVTGTCVSCHDGTKSTATMPIKGKTPGVHFNTTNACVNCHKTTTWAPAILPLDHGQVIGTCISCHTAGKATTHTGAGHVQAPGDANCQDCHTTVNWNSSAKPDHTNFTATQCATCHAGTGVAMHKSPTHFASNNSCLLCHNTTAFKPAVTFDHVNGGMTGTCVSCHNGLRVPALGKISAPTPHVKTSDNCATCHSSFTTWANPVKIHSVADPIVTAATCVSCHDNAHPPAIGKSPTHFKTSTDCASCHVLSSWTVGVGKFNHADSGVVGSTCFSCHDGAPAHAPAMGKLPNHLVTNNVCENCHKTTAWIPAGFDHTTVSPGTCFSCHNGVKAKGKTLATHFATSNTCDACHTTIAWTPVSPAAFDHTQATGSCFSCHSGSKPPAVGKLSSHITSSNNCDACHTTAAWKPVPAANVDHTQVTGTCFSCHNGTKATGKSKTHFTTTNTCDACHTTLAWTPVSPTAFDHTQATGTCVSCHSGTKPPAVGKGLTHIKSTTTCDACHTTANWTAAFVDHTQVTPTTCVSCHNGTIATGKTTFGKHFNTTDTCSSCHGTKDTRTKAAAAWTVVKTAFDHTQAIGICTSCHLAGVVPVGEVKSSNHFRTTVECSACHTTTNWTTLLPYTHASPQFFNHNFGNTVAACARCHTTTPMNGVITFRFAGPDCALCHTDKYKTGPHTKFGSSSYTVTELGNCAGACHIYTDGTLSTIKTKRTGHHKATDGSF